MAEFKFTDISHLKGGFNKWKEENMKRKKLL